MPNFGAPHSSGEPGAAVDGHLLRGDRIDSNLAAEEKLVLISKIEIENGRVLQEELQLLGNVDHEDVVHCVRINESILARNTVRSNGSTM
jgi:hypothetical protein